MKYDTHDIQYIAVKTYGNGKYMNKVYPMWFGYLSQAERICSELNKQEDIRDGCGEKWIPMPIIHYEGSVW